MSQIWSLSGNAGNYKISWTRPKEFFQSTEAEKSAHFKQIKFCDILNINMEDKTKAVSIQIRRWQRSWNKYMKLTKYHLLIVFYKQQRCLWTKEVTRRLSGSEFKRDSADKKHLVMLTSQNGKMMYIMAHLAFLMVYCTDGKIIAQKWQLSHIQADGTWLKIQRHKLFMSISKHFLSQIFLKIWLEFANLTMSRNKAEPPCK